MKQYYSVLVASENRAKSLFTYVSHQELSDGVLVRVPFLKRLILGIVIRKTSPFKGARSIGAVYEQIVFVPQIIATFFELADRSGVDYSGIASMLLGNANPDRDISLPPSSNTKELPPLTADQQIALNQISKSQNGKPILLHGRTGSGKTRIYIEMAKQVLASGRSCIVLSPEVGLSTQLYRDFLEAFGEHKTITMHSRLTKKKREEIWLRIATSQAPSIVVGPRSALSLPHQNLGLIIMDEFHDDSYQQNNQPRYHSINLASFMSRHFNAKLVCGSATPNIADYYNFEKYNYTVVNLTTSARLSTPAKVEIIDMRQEHDPLLSKAAKKAIEQSLARCEQVLVCLNRRGSSRLTICPNCDWQHLCPKCAYQLVLHQDHHTSRCHSCAWQETPLLTCPTCNKPLDYRVPGVKKLTQNLQNLFPSAKIARFDSDNLEKDSLATRLNEIKDAPGTIIIGTQMIAKGLDLQLLGTVIIVKAETSLAIPDYRADEKMYQLVVQLIGRVGRGHMKDTRVLIQTNQPDNITLRSAAQNNWQKFYLQELKHRQQAGFPPFNNIVSIRVRRKTQKGVIKAAEQLLVTLKKDYTSVDWRGPTPALREQSSTGYEWIIHGFCQQRSPLVEFIKQHNKEVAELNPTQLF